jgi:hypothetical protein
MEQERYRVWLPLAAVVALCFLASLLTWLVMSRARDENLQLWAPAAVIGIVATLALAEWGRQTCDNSLAYGILGGVGAATGMWFAYGAKIATGMGDARLTPLVWGEMVFYLTLILPFAAVAGAVLGCVDWCIAKGAVWLKQRFVPADERWEDKWKS